MKAPCSHQNPDVAAAAKSDRHSVAKTAHLVFFANNAAMSLWNLPFRRLLAAWNERVLVLKIACYACIGVANTLIDFCVFLIAVQFFAVPLIPANVVSWLAGASNSYVLNALFTFARESNRELRWRDYAKFLSAGLVGLIINTTTLVVAVGLMPRLTADTAHQLAAAKACAIMVGFLVNFSMSYFVVFRRKS